MNPDQTSLWHRIQAHALDDPFAPCPFSSRLAKENAWGPAFTQRVLEEYRRFAFLAVAAGHPVSPSDAVDQAWHLHLLYTRDYWGEFCPGVLRTPLHHGPTRGGADEHHKFADWYGRTLASYRNFFGEPPVDIWPNPASHPEAVRIDPARHWVIAKPRWLAGMRQMFSRLRPTPREAVAKPTLVVSSASARVGTVLGLGFVVLHLWPTRMAAASSPGWPFGLPGPAFLEFFSVLMVVLGIGAVLLRRHLRQPVELAAKKPMLDGYEAAYLAGGPARTFAVALVGVAHRKLIEVNKGIAVRTATSAPANLPIIERAICAAAQPTGTTLRTVRGCARGAVEGICASLVEQGMVLDDTAARKARLLPVAVMAIAWVIGAIKYKIGQDLGRPVGWLMVFLALVTAAMLVFILKRPRLSRRGERALENLRTEYSSLESDNGKALRGSEAPLLLPLAVGLFGASVLQSTPLYGLEHELGSLLSRRKDSLGGGGCSSCGTAGSSCGGGGGSCGGGGGCGGCGGGGD